MQLKISQTKKVQVAKIFPHRNHFLLIIATMGKKKLEIYCFYLHLEQLQKEQQDLCLALECVIP